MDRNAPCVWCHSSLTVIEQMFERWWICKFRKLFPNASDIRHLYKTRTTKHDHHRSAGRVGEVRNQPASTQAAPSVINPEVRVRFAHENLWVLATNASWKEVFKGRSDTRYAGRMLNDLFGEAGTASVRKAIQNGETKTSIVCPVRGQSGTYNVTIVPADEPVLGFVSYTLTLEDVTKFEPDTVQAALGGPTEVTGMVDRDGVIIYVYGKHSVAPLIDLAVGLEGVTLDHSIDYRDYTPGEPLHFDLELSGRLYKLTVVVTHGKDGTRMFHSRVDEIFPKEHGIVA